MYVGAIIWATCTVHVHVTCIKGHFRCITILLESPHGNALLEELLTSSKVMAGDTPPPETLRMMTHPTSEMMRVTAYPHPVMWSQMTKPLRVMWDLIVRAMEVV